MLSSSTSRPTIDFGLVTGILGYFIFFLGVGFLFPLIIDLIFQENQWQYFLASSGICFTMGALILVFFRSKEELRAREGFLIVSLTWLTLSIFGALPFYISGILPHFTDAVFETMSGFTTTGATILGGVTSNNFANPAIEDVPNAFLFWRSLTQWLGGMGIIVLSLAILPLLGIGGMQLFQAESSVQSSDKLTPRVQETAKLLWVVYVAFTLLEFLLLWLHPAMNWFDALNHSFTTMATGGFSTKNASIEAYNSVYIEMVITLFMFIAGINFAMHFRLFRGEVGTFFKNRETRFYALIVMLGTLLVSFSLWVFDGYDLLQALRYGFFQVVSIITTTGYGSNDYEAWYAFGGVILLLLFFTGASTGSTAGGIKMVRWMILIRNTGREIKQIMHPKAILPVRIGDQTINPHIQRTVLSFFILYIFIFGLGTLLISLFGYDIQTSVGASITALGNVGPGFGEFGPTDSFAKMPFLGKWFMIILMMIGRLEILTVFIIFSPAFWRK